MGRSASETDASGLVANLFKTMPPEPATTKALKSKVFNFEETETYSSQVQEESASPTITNSVDIPAYEG